MISPLPTAIFLPAPTFIPPEKQPDLNFPKSNRIRSEFGSKFRRYGAISHSPEFTVCSQRQQRHCCCPVSYTMVTGSPYVVFAWSPPSGIWAKTPVCLGSGSHRWCHQHSPVIPRVFSSFYFFLSLLVKYNIHTYTHQGMKFYKTKPFRPTTRQTKICNMTNKWEGSPLTCAPSLKDHHYLDFFPYRSGFLLLQCI